jgi:glycosyltransferase involved in cell wall biosynthesis
MSVCLVGHPYAPLGMGEHVRCTFRALRSIGRAPTLFDLYGLNTPEASHETELVPFQAKELGDINVFHINGDEVEQALAHVAALRATRAGSFNIIYPAWELARYPSVWLKQLERFDEVWAPSTFIAESIAPGTEKPVIPMPLACEVLLNSFAGRRYFGIPESAYVFLFFFDVRSYATRKNPRAVVEAFRRLIALRPDQNSSLVVKVNGAQLNPTEFQSLKESTGDLTDRIVLIDRTMDDNEVKNLVRCCDCFVSMHRSEGYGRGISEAMCLGKPVIATGYSGNMDFMTGETAFPIGFDLVPVAEGEYPHWQDQVWAEPHLDEAVAAMARLVDDPALGYEIGRRAALHMRTRFGYRPTGLRYAERLDQIERQSSVELIPA